MNKRVNTMYFSPTGTAKKVVKEIENKISQKFKNQLEIDNIDFTLSQGRNKELSFTKNDIVIIGVPVYAGRVPNILLEYLHSIKGNGALAVAVVLYGNRHYDDALIELRDILTSNKFNVIGASAFIGEHSFSKVLAKGRPNDIDLSVAREFGEKIYRKIKEENLKEVKVKGNRPYRKYYMPKDENNNPVDIRKVTPKTRDSCIDCKICAKLCPVGSIDYENVHKLNGICIKCCACIKRCPTNSKYFDDKEYLRHKLELEVDFVKPKNPEIFI